MAAKTVVLLNQKGGVGKSTICDELLYGFARDGLPASFFDLDRQGSPMHEPQEVEDAVVAVVDTPGALLPEMAEWARAADLVVVPTRCSTYDMAPLDRMRDMLDGLDVPVIWVLNGWTRFKVAAQFEEWFRSDEAKFMGRGRLLARLPSSEMFVQAASRGISVVEHAPRSTAARAMSELYGMTKGVLVL